MSEERRVVVVGAGGHAKVVIATLRSAGWYPEAAFDDAEEIWGTKVLGVPVRGAIELLEGSSRPGVLAIGSNSVRRTLAERLRLDWATVIHPSAVVEDTAKLGVGTVVFAGAVAQPEAVIGRHAVLNTGCSVDHDCTIGDFAHIAPGARLGGSVVVEEGALVGIGAVVAPQRRIGAWATVGAGATVVREVEAETTVVGVPSRTLR